MKRARRMMTAGLNSPPEVEKKFLIDIDWMWFAGEYGPFRASASPPF